MRAAPVMRIAPLCRRSPISASAWGSRASRNGKADSGQIKWVTSATPVELGEVARSDSAR